MNSAAVIGRQLRQQQASSRISGPVVPPTQYKGRALSSFSSAQGPRQDRDLLSLATQSNLGADADKPFAKFSQIYSHDHFYPHPAHRETGEKSVRRKEKKKKEPRVQLSWHCFCVALKALSSGLVLLILGSVMSVVGFCADSLSQQSVRLQNGTLVTKVDGDVKTHLHNLTYVGPVIMGLGGMVLVAACVLTFEVRDTLGVKLSPEKLEVDRPAKSEKSGEKNNLQMPSSSKPSSSREDSKGRPSTSNALNQNHLPEHSAVNGSQQGAKPKAKDKLSEPGLPGKGGQSSRIGKSHSEKAPTPQERTFSGKAVSNDAERQPPQVQQRPSLYSNDLFSIDMSFVRIPSPQDTELSDPEGCSLHTLTRWKSRCSCSGSPTNSMRMLALQSFDERQRNQPWGNSSGRSKNAPRPLLGQLPHRSSKILASVESDGLSSSTSSDWELDYRLLETQQNVAHSRTRLRNDHPYCIPNDRNTCELPSTAHYSPQSLNSTNQQKLRTNVSLPRTQCKSNAGHLDANFRSGGEPVENVHFSALSSFPLLRMSSLEELPPSQGRQYLSPPSRHS